MTGLPRRRHLTVYDVMTTDVVVAHADDGFKEVAERLVRTAVSALPVVDQSREVLGVISEADLLLKEGVEVQEPPFYRRNLRREVSKGKALVVADAMSAPAITIGSDQTVAQAARLMHKRGLKHLPVVDTSNRLVGMVSRHDLISVFARTDESIREEVLKGIFGQEMMIDTLGVSVSVEDGVVTLVGEVERKSELPIITLLVSGTDGVVAVNNLLTSEWDDTNLDPGSMLPHGSIAGLY